MSSDARVNIWTLPVLHSLAATSSVIASCVTEFVCWWPGWLVWWLGQTTNLCLDLKFWALESNGPVLAGTSSMVSAAVRRHYNGSSHVTVF